MKSEIGTYSHISFSFLEEVKEEMIVWYCFIRLYSMKWKFRFFFNFIFPRSFPFYASQEGPLEFSWIFQFPPPPTHDIKVTELESLRTKNITSFYYTLTYPHYRKLQNVLLVFSPEVHDLRILSWPWVPRNRFLKLSAQPFTIKLFDLLH